MFFSYIKILLENGIFLPLKLYDINPPLLRCLKKRIHASNIVHAILRSIYFGAHCRPKEFNELMPIRFRDFIYKNPHVSVILRILCFSQKKLSKNIHIYSPNKNWAVNVGLEKNCITKNSIT